MARGVASISGRFVYTKLISNPTLPPAPNDCISD